MQDFNDLFDFVKAVEHGSYAAAARALALPKSRLSCRLMILEVRLGIQRSTLKPGITVTGQECDRPCVAIGRSVAESVQAILPSR